VALIAHSKASVGLFFVGLLMIRVIFLRSHSIYIDLLTTLLSAAIVFWSVIDTVEAVSEFIPIIPLSFISDYSFMGSQFSYALSVILNGKIPSLDIFAFAFFSFVSFILLHFLASWFVIFVNSKYTGISSILKMPVTSYSLASIGAGFFVIMLFSMPGGAVYYFSNVSFFVSIPFFIGILVNFSHSKGFDDRLLLGSAIIIISLILLHEVIQ
jgi:hypothetical protein